MSIPKLAVTKEHGSWAVLLLPMVIGAGVSRTFSIKELLLALAEICIFLSYVPVQSILRHRFVHPQNDGRTRDSGFWFILLCAASILSGGYLFVMGFLYLFPIGVLGGACFLGNFFAARRYQKNVGGDLLAVAGLTLGAPAMYYVATGHLDAIAWSLWMFSFLFFGSTVFYVHMKMLASGMKRTELTFLERVSLGKLNIGYHIVVVALVGLFAFVHLTSWVILLAFVPMIFHALLGTVRLSSHVRYRALGYILLAQSLIFSFLVLLIEHR